MRISRGFLGLLIFIFLNVFSFSEEEDFSSDAIERILKRKNCFNCIDVAEEKDTDLFIFMSFSVPENTWKELSNEVKKAEAVFILRGLPGNSFNEFFSKISELKKKGIAAPIQIFPEYFKKYEINHCPAFVFKEGEKFDKVSGNISLGTALEIISRRGETFRSKDLIKKIKKGGETLWTFQE